MDILDKLLINLETISNITKHAKLSTCGEYINIDEYSIIQPLARTFRGDGISKALPRINNVVDVLIYISILLMDSKTIDEITILPADEIGIIAQETPRAVTIRRLKLIHKHFYRSQQGFDKLIETYSCDANIVTSILDIKSKITAHTRQLENFIKSIGERVDAGYANFAG